MAPSNSNPVSLDVAQALPEEMCAEVATWLARLVLLYGVPLTYLVPEESMLPKESLRFFFVDPIWIQSLVQGASSVGNNGYGDSLIDQALSQWTQPNQPTGAAQPSLTNQKAAGVRDRLRLQYEAAPLPAEEACLNWPLTGFLLRSPVIEGWRGIEILGYRSLSEAERQHFDTASLNDEQKKKFATEGVVPLQALRLEQLGKDIMLGIFNGVIHQLIVRQPQEGLHFGLSISDTAAVPSAVAYVKSLRELGYKDPKRAGELLPTTIDLSGERLMREQPERGVVRIAELASRMKSTLAAAAKLEDDRFTSAEFAVEMIEAAGEFTFSPTFKTL
jgi:hypothetical protein